MRQLLRILLNVGRATSFVLCMAIAVLWVCPSATLPLVWAGLPCVSVEEGDIVGREALRDGSGNIVIGDANPVFEVAVRKVLAASAILPLVWIVARHLLGNRPRRGFCRACNYDLRATPDRCPECGAIPLAEGARLPGPGG
jgi:hypothetical protein